MMLRKLSPTRPVISLLLTVKQDRQGTGYDVFENWSFTSYSGPTRPICSSYGKATQTRNWLSNDLKRIPNSACDNFTEMLSMTTSLDL